LRQAHLTENGTDRSSALTRRRVGNQKVDGTRRKVFENPPRWLILTDAVRKYRSLNR